MDWKKMTISFLFALLLVLSTGCGSSGEAESPVPEQPETEQQEDQPAETVPAPDFTVYDKEGNAVSLSDFFGKPIVLNFWASWCGPCTGEMPEFQAAFEEQGEAVQFLMINVTGGRETVQSASKFIEKEGYTFPVFYDTDLEASTLYGASALPTTFFIDKDGNAIAYAMGALSAEKLQIGIDAVKP